MTRGEALGVQTPSPVTMRITEAHIGRNSRRGHWCWLNLYMYDYHVHHGAVLRAERVSDHATNLHRTQ